jgi:predicted glycoside hydrolase/deacetylase ChbG (UPF0249 family)
VGATVSHRRLVVNADDFGLSEGVNRGIIAAHLAGVVTSTSMLVNTPAWEDAAARARSNSRLGVGLHLNLTAGRPLTRAPSLSDASGLFRPLAQLAARAWTGRIDAADVAAECRAQLARLQQAGVVITHLDSHRHVHLLPGVWAPVAAAAREAAVSVVRVPLEPLGFTPGNWRALLKKLALVAAWGVLPRGGERPRCADHCRGVSLVGGPGYLAALVRILDTLPPGTTELIVHPGSGGDDLAGWDDYDTPRSEELAALTSASVRSRLARGDIELVHFGVL